LACVAKALLAPHAGHDLGQREHVDGGRDDDAVAEGGLDQIRRALGGGGQEMLAGDEHDHEIGRKVELPPIAFAAEIIGIGLHRQRVLQQVPRADRLVLLVERLFEGDQRAFDVDHDAAVARQLDDAIGAQLPLAVRHGRLKVEIDILGQPRRLEDGAQLLLAPAAARLGAGAQYVGEPLRLADPQFVTLRDAGDHLLELAIAIRPRLLDLLEAKLVALERGLDRLEQRLQFLLILLAGMAEALLGLLEEAIVRAVHRLGRELAEARLELPFDLFELGELLLVRLGALRLAALEPGLGRGEQLLLGTKLGQLPILQSHTIGHRPQLICFGRAAVAACLSLTRSFSTPARR
jgi:hypothetical protein